MKDFNNIPLPRTFINKIEFNVPVKVILNKNKVVDIFIGDLVIDDIEKRLFVIFLI